jgi:unsaturated rhamnogalacturonyl hydrolase
MGIDFPKEDMDIIEKVKLAMLSTQRDAWEQGVAAQALMELGEIDLAIMLAREAVLRQCPDGRLAIIRDTDAVTDPAASGEAVLFAAKMTSEPKFKQAADRMLAYLLNNAPRTQDGILHHINSRPELWIDSAYMAPPFLAAAGRPDEAVRQIEGYRKYLWDAQKKLFSHIWDAERHTFIRRDFWGVGNGWAAAGMSRIIHALPPEMGAERQRLIGYVHEVIDGCLACQRADGLFHDVVDNPSSFVETNLAQMLAYTIFRGLKSGWIEERYRVFADRMRAASHSKVDKSGFVYEVCGSPNFDHPGTATEGQAFFLLMEAAFQDL